MFPRLLLLVVIQFGLAAFARAEPSKLTGEALRQAVSGRTVLLETPIGSLPIRYRRDGTMTGQAPAFVASLGTEKDRGDGVAFASRRATAAVHLLGKNSRSPSNTCCRAAQMHIAMHNNDAHIVSAGAHGGVALSPPNRWIRP